MPQVSGEITVVIADDDPRVGPAVAGLLEQERDFRVLGHAATGDEAVAAAQELRPALVLTDVRMPGGGPDLIRRLVALPHRPVVAGFSAQADAATWTGILAAGASAYLLKGSVAGDLPALLLQQPGHGGSDAGVVVRDDDGDLTADLGHRSTLAYGGALVLMRAHRATSTRALELRPTDVPESRARLGP